MKKMYGIGNTIYELKRIYGCKWIEIHVNTEDRKDDIISTFLYHDFTVVENSLFKYEGSTFRVILNYEMENDYQILIDFKSLQQY